MESRLNDRTTESGSDAAASDAPPSTVMPPSSPERKPARLRRERRRPASREAIDESNGELVRRYQAVLQQTIAAHRVIGRLNFERDALAHQLETLRARPPGAVTAPASLVALAQATPEIVPSQQNPSLLQMLDRFFNSGDIWDVRKKRLGFVFGLLAVVIVTWAVSQTGLVVLPARISRDSLGDLPFVGTSLRLAMGVWSMFRVVRIGARGVRWAFPEENSRRRRR